VAILPGSGFGTTSHGFFELIEEAMGTIIGEGLNSVTLVRFYDEANMHAFLLEQFGLYLHGCQPLGVPLADVHVNAKRLESIDSRVAFIPKIAGKARHRSEILRIRCSDVECAEPSIGWACDVQLFAFNPVVAQNLIQELRENAVCSSFKEQVVGRRYRAHDDISPSLSLSAPIPVEHVVDGIQVLTSTRECKYGRIRPARIIVTGQDYFVSDGNAAKPSRLGDSFSIGRWRQYECYREQNDRRYLQFPPSRFSREATEAPQTGAQRERDSAKHKEWSTTRHVEERIAKHSL